MHPENALEQSLNRTRNSNAVSELLMVASVSLVSHISHLSEICFTNIFFHLRNKNTHPNVLADVNRKPFILVFL